MAVGRPLSASVGLAMFPQDGRTPDEIIDRADHDQRMVKQAGGAVRGHALYAV
jgi:predicted signal transduction protein with EAL and GGDEF domain